MPNEDKMDIDERHKYLRIKQKPYRQAKRKERSRMLNEMEQVTGLDRKPLIRHMKRRKIERKVRRGHGDELLDLRRLPRRLSPVPRSGLTGLTSRVTGGVRGEPLRALCTFIMRVV